MLPSQLSTTRSMDTRMEHARGNGMSGGGSAETHIAPEGAEVA